VTTIVRVLGKGEALLQWAVDCSLEAISKAKDPTPQIWEAARYAWRDKRDSAGVKGTDAHDIIEAYVREWIAEWNGHCTYTWADKTEITDTVRPFVNWARDNDIRFLDCEVVQHSKEHWYAGRFDLLYEFKGETWLGDIKTSKGVYPENFIQLGGYDIMCQEGGIDVAHRAVLHLKKDTLEVHPSFDRKRDTESFLSCLKLYNLLRTYQ
jgi:hypothetical protein